jgi:hypothetical protein
MMRFLQGNVGNGQTVVALIAMLATVERGAQAALLAPRSRRASIMRASTHGIGRHPCRRFKPVTNPPGQLCYHSIRLVQMNPPSPALRERVPRAAGQVREPRSSFSSPMAQAARGLLI